MALQRGLRLPQGVCDNAVSEFSTCSLRESGETPWELISDAVPQYSSDICQWECSECHPGHPGQCGMAGHGITAVQSYCWRGTLHPRGSQECTHTNKIHISVTSLHGYLPWPKFSCSPALFPLWLTSSLPSRGFIHSEPPVWLVLLAQHQQPVSAAAHPAEVWGALSPSCGCPGLPSQPARPGDRALTCHGGHTPRDSARAQSGVEGQEGPSSSGAVPEELGERDLLQGREFSCWGGGRAS